jgi:ribose transport system ATP-binding protein
MSLDVERPVLEAIGISKSFPGVRALSGVSMRAYPGQLTAVLGENGAGKSTLMNILSGVYEPDDGEVRIDGISAPLTSPHDARECGITTIFQELNLIPDLSVAENIFLGREFLTPLGLIDYGRMHDEARVLLGKLGLAVDPKVSVSSLRVGQQQIVEIAKALSFEARVLIMDEPTSALSEHEVEILFDIVRSLKEDGVAILYITHKLEELSRIGDRYAVLRDGELMGTGWIRDVEPEALIRMMVGREVQPAERVPAGDRDEDAVLRVESLTLAHPRRRGDFLLSGINLHVRRGEILGVFGLMGAGRTELCEAMFGLHSTRTTGAIYVEGTRVDIRSPGDAIAAGIGWTPEDRKTEGLVLEMSVAENASLASLERVERCGMLDPRSETKHVGSYLERLQVKTPSLRQKIKHLSGGNQQKVILAKWLATNPRVLLLDEPTRGIDVSAKGEIHALLGELASAGLGIVMISSELPEILANADRIVVLAEGEKTAEFSGREATEAALVRAALPRSSKECA